MIATLMLMLQAAPSAAATCTPALVAKATPAGWDADAVAADGGRLVPGRAAAITLTPGVRFAVAPAKPAAAGASASFDVARAGRWRVSLNQGAWVDVIRGGAVIRSVAHGHGAPCSGVRKQVDFDLTPGRYVLQLSGAASARVRAMVSPV